MVWYFGIRLYGRPELRAASVLSKRSLALHWQQVRPVQRRRGHRGRMLASSGTLRASADRKVGQVCAHQC